MRQRFVVAAGILGLVVGASVVGVRGVAAASNADLDFVAKVSQGGTYEVEASKIAMVRGQTIVVKDLGRMESFDHEGVNAQIRRLAGDTGAIPPGLNPEFSARLEKLKAVPLNEFDADYVQDMKQIHQMDLALFVQESQAGSPVFAGFARETAVLVKAHLGWLNTL